MKRKQIGSWIVDTYPEGFMTQTYLHSRRGNASTGEDFIELLDHNEYHLDPWAIDVLLKPEFDRSSAGQFQVTALSKAFGRKHPKYLDVSAKAAPLLRMNISDEEMRQLGVALLFVMHSPILDSRGDPRILALWSGGRGKGLVALPAHETKPYDAGTGQAYAYLEPKG
jgi:hypothetical protein